jgi:Flp pilus assembly protein TadG
MRRASFVNDQGGAAAVEFALATPVLAFLIFGSINLCMVLYSVVTIQSAVEQAARYASAYTSAHGGTDPGSTTVISYAKTQYAGPNIGATYTYSDSDSCATYNGSSVGHRVTASGSYKLFFGVEAVSVPISATACFA